MGPVFRGEDSESRTPVVIKAIRAGLTPERVAVVGPALRALKERLVEHPSLCPILETGVVALEPFVVTPVVEGDSLDVALREYGPANLADALPRLRAVADALDAAAAVDVAHGSLHLRDIVVSVEKTVLTGIGIAAVLERVGVRPPVRRPYTAPEVALGRGISPAGDQYSLAAIAHEWLSGRRVSGTDGILVATSSPEGAAALAAVFGKAMAVEPADRYPSATAFVDALAGVGDVVAPRSRAPRRKPPTPAPLLQFEAADEPPALTFAPPEPEPAPVASAAREVEPDDALPDDVGPDDMVPDDRGALDYDGDLPLVTGPRDLGDGEDAPEEAVDDVRYARPETVSLPYADDPQELATPPMPPVTEPEGDARGMPSWMLWAGVVLGGILLVVMGGGALLRWDTPGPATSALNEAATVAPATTPADPTASTPAPSAAAPVPVEPPRPSPESDTTVARPSEAATAPRRAAPPPSSPAVKAPAARPSTSTPVRRPVAKSPPRRPAAARPAAARPAAAVQPGRLLVRSTPSGAEVFLNGERRGVSPVALRDLALGAYTVRFERAGFAPVEQRVVLEAARPARALEVALARSGTAAASTPAGATTGSLRIESRPSGARAFVDGVDVGRTPVTVPDVKVGSRAVRIELPGYLNVSTATRVEPGVRGRVAVTLTAERPR